jgi:anthranilate synthase/aminodeoxychorismate synthase-like glutamine amidotransferase
MNARVLVVDNHDSFTYNLVQALSGMGAEVIVRMNDEITAPAARDLRPTHLLISPGPGRPERAGATTRILEAMLDRVPVLGVCLGHQALGALMGARIVSARSLLHGKASPVYHDGRTIFDGLPSPLRAGRYHSLAVSEEGLPDELAVSAWTSDGEIMGLRHSRYPVEGVQFHPESVLTPEGARLLANFLDLTPAGGDR